MFVTAALLLLLLVIPTAYAMQYTVGDSSGWTLTGDYSTWVQGKTFTVGDILWPMYFICPAPGHRASIMKLAINVAAVSGTSPTTLSPPSGSTTPSGTLPRGSTSSLSPHPSGAPTIMNNGLMLGFSLTLVAAFAIMS